MQAAVRALFGGDRAESGIDAALVAKSPPEEPADALHVAVEVPGKRDRRPEATRRNLA